MKKENVGFVGLGEMGLPMAINLQNGGFKVNAFDVDGSRCLEATQAGISCYSSPRDVAIETDKAIFSIVRTVEQTESVLFNENGILSSDKKGLNIVIMSTLDPFSIKKIEKKARNKGNYLIDAPVSGSKTGAENATLTILTSGDEKKINECKKYFNKMGKNIFYFGSEVGSGQVAKLSNNLVLATNMVGFAEGMRFAEKFGISNDKFNEFINVSTGSSWVSKNWEKQIKLWYEEYEPNQTLDIVYKDLKAIINTCSEEHFSLPFGGLAFQILLDSWRRSA
jgi:3-hydroxyisobutyrate dehydrogenase